MMRRRYSLQGSYLELLTDWDEAVEWADLCLLPYVSIGGGETRVARLDCHYGEPAPPPAGGEPQPRLIHMGREAVSYVVDGRTAEVRTPDGVVYRLADDRIEIFYPDRTEDALRDPGRLCREILYNSLPVGAWYELHASAVARNGKAVIFIGPKGAGKSTMLCQLLSGAARDKSFDFVSNDRVWVNVSRRPVQVIGSPMPVCLGYGTMMSVPQLAAGLSLFRDYIHLMSKSWSVKGHEYSVNEFARFFQCSVRTEAVAAAVVGLKPGRADALRLVEGDEERAAVLNGGDRHAERTYPNWMGIGHPTDERRPARLDPSRLACPVYEMEFTPSEAAPAKCAEVVTAGLGALLA